jgi:hypothetical protein
MNDRELLTIFLTLNKHRNKIVMKKYIKNACVLALIALCAIPALAQLNGTGYYRVRNAQYTNEYIKISNDLLNYHKIVNAAGGGFALAFNTNNARAKALEFARLYLKTDIKMMPAEYIDPTSVIYAQKKNTNSSNHDYNLIGQGTSLLTITTGMYDGSSADATFNNLYVTIDPVNGSGSGASTRYTAKLVLQGTAMGMTASLGTRYFMDDNSIFDIDEANSNLYDQWYIEPVTYFNVKPDVELNGKYYTTIKVPFAFKLSNNVEKAYTITAVNSGILEYQEIASTGGTVPAGTPVLLQCSSPNATDCHLIPDGTPTFTDPDPNSSTNGSPRANQGSNYSGTNLLDGTYFANTDGTQSYNGYSFDANNYAGTSGKYVIGMNNGKLGFIAATGTTMPANKAWMTSAGLFPTLATPTITPASGTYTSAQTVTITAEEGATIEYSTDGGTTWQTYNGAFTVDETTTIKARATKQGLYNNSDVATSQIEISIPNPVLTVNPTMLTINDLGGSFTVEGSDLGTDGVGVTTNNGFATTTSDQDWGFVPNNGTVNGTVNVSYQGRELKATGTVNVANNVISNHVDVTYQTDIYIVTDNGVQGNWNFNNGTQMTNEDGTYTATFNALADNTFILFARKLGDGVDWNTRYVFGPVSDGDWAMPADKATEYGNIDVNDDDPIKLPYAGEYTITINGNDKTFTITRTIETVATPEFTPAAGTYTGTQTVSITCDTEGAAIYYKINDGEYQPYNGSIEVAESCTITAKATKDGWNESEEATAEYVIEIPVVHKPGDVNHDGNVNIKDVTDLIDHLLDIDNGICLICADVKEDNAINIADVTNLIDMLLENQPTE